MMMIITTTIIMIIMISEPRHVLVALDPRVGRVGVAIVHLLRIFMLIRAMCS